MIPLRPFLAVVLSITTVILTAQEKYNLEFKYQPGGIYRYCSVDTFSSEQQLGGKDINLSGGKTSRVKMEVEDGSSDTNIIYITSVEEMKTFIKSPVMDTVLDQQQMIGKRVRIRMDKYGTAIGRVTLDSNEKSDEGLSLGILSENSLTLFQLPDHPVSAGEKWATAIHDSIPMSNGFRTETRSVEYTLNGFGQKNGHDCVKIYFTSTSEYAGKFNQMGMGFFIEGTGDSEGVIWFDAVKGILILRESTTMQDMTVALTGTETMSVPMTQSIRSSLSLVEN